MEEWSEAAVLKLIEFYEKTPILYDPSNPNYRNRDIKRQKRTEIVHILDRNGEYMAFFRTRLHCLRHAHHLQAFLFGTSTDE